jgi:hypothetical protein
MMMIYSPTRLRGDQEEQLEAALARDRARVHYQGNDGDEEYVIVEAAAFTHTEEVGRTLGLTLAMTETRPTKRSKT